MKIGYVLSGGAARSIAHIGTIKALEEMGIRPTIISAVSGGALFGVGIAAGYSPEETLEKVLKVGTVRWFYPSTKSGGMFTLSRIEAALREEATMGTFEELKIPMIVTATDIINGVPVYLSEGDLITAIIASCSYPAIFEPVYYNGHTLLDGGIVNNFPVEPLEGKCDKIIGMSTGSGHAIKKITSVQQIMIRTMGLAITEHDKSRFPKADIVIEPRELHGYGMFDGGKGREIYDIGYKHTKKIQKEIEEVLSL